MYSNVIVVVTCNNKNQQMATNKIDDRLFFFLYCVVGLNQFFLPLFFTNYYTNINILSIIYIYIISTHI
jgi:hypothetical protein